MVSEKASQRWQYWKERLQSTEDKEAEQGFHDIQDTVGAVASCNGHMSAGVSSGGLLLKYPGRIGEASAAVYGAGCWAQEMRGRKMACSISGTGEYIIRSNLARTIGKVSNEDDLHEALERTLTADFWGTSPITAHLRSHSGAEQSRNAGEPNPNAGVLMMTADSETTVRLWCAFTTPTMAIAYASSTNPNPKVRV
ncbi:hypothetical protein D9758_001916 [Tetrapyrgos nigripes]|uniref:Threonine aspartase n=1 Tax=Tetrapyrgos nigripes TaxID=182062 RepID=A0A8H5GTS9_9AGAR|nr:hypothetical protein D9758_001916 [Tetrapyrgos nigripes]